MHLKEKSIIRVVVHKVIIFKSMYSYFNKALQMHLKQINVYFIVLCDDKNLEKILFFKKTWMEKLNTSRNPVLPHQRGRHNLYVLWPNLVRIKSYYCFYFSKKANYQPKTYHTTGKVLAYCG